MPGARSDCTALCMLPSPINGQYSSFLFENVADFHTTFQLRIFLFLLCRILQRVGDTFDWTVFKLHNLDLSHFDPSSVITWAPPPPGQAMPSSEPRATSAALTPATGSSLAPSNSSNGTTPAPTLVSTNASDTPTFGLPSNSSNGTVLDQGLTAPAADAAAAAARAAATSLTAPAARQAAAPLSPNSSGTLVQA
jgi:hypothetical protein